MVTLYNKSTVSSAKVCSRHDTELHLVLRPQFWRTGQFGLALDSYYFQVPLDMEWYYPVGWEAVEYTDSISAGGVRPPPNECPWYDTKQSDSAAPVMPELWGIWSTLSLPSLPDPLWPGVITSDRFLSMGKIELNYVLVLNWNVWNRTVFDIELVHLLNWNIWSRRVFYIETGVLMLNWIVWNRTVSTLDCV